MPLDLLTAAQVAEQAGVNRRTVTRWVESGRLPVAFSVPGDTGANLFDPIAVAALLAEVTP